LNSTKPTVIGSLVTDIVLLIIMFVGLLDLRLQAGGTFNLGRMLWKQVRRQFSLVVILYSLI
jgi:hypothetical protein